MTERHVESVEPLYNWGRPARTGAEPTPPPYQQMCRDRNTAEDRNTTSRSINAARVRNRNHERRDA